MLNPMLKLFTEGDVKEARSHLLHSTAWIQHQLTAYGNEQISRCWMVWLSVCGLSECREVVSLKNNGQSLHLLSLVPHRAEHEVRLGLWSWNNGSHIKRMVCHIDTGMMVTATGIPEAELADLLPTADPLIISDYDQQEHPHSVSVSPSDLVDLNTGVAEAVAGWWSLWQDMQLANIERLYARDARIQVPGQAGNQGADQLREYCSQWFLGLRRRFCQPESLLVDNENPGRVGVLWHMEGDVREDGRVRRVRIPFVNLLEVREGLIVRDSTLVDSVAWKKWRDA